MKNKFTLYNTLTKNIESLKPIKDKLVTIYSCGPTLYDHIHIGNMSSFIYADTLKRALKASGYKVKHVMNFTDVDDKTIARSLQRFPDDDPNVALHKLTEEYRELFLNDMKMVGNQIDDIEFMSATENIDEMKNYIKVLHDKGFAYIADDGVYFSIEAYKKAGKVYGQLTNITESNTSNARISNDEYDKESVHDFALWKLHKDEEPSWEFEMDGHKLDGRPGWHIECSAMSVKALGIPFDIHTGGIDLIFPHHENEIAQSTATTATDKLANIFFHNEHLLIDGKKMSKSLNNYITLEDIKEHGFDPLAFRLLVLQSHYRNQSNFTWENLEAAQNRLKSFRDTGALRWQTIYGSNDASTYVLHEVKESLKLIACNDIGTPRILSNISDVFNQLNLLLLDRDKNNRYNNLDDFIDLVNFINDLLGLNLLSVSDINAEQKSLISKRETVRKKNDWRSADEIRNTLRKQGIEINDTPRGQIWSRI